MTDSFSKALKFTLVAEGGKCDVKGDRGGKTNQGITQTAYDAYRTRLGQTKNDVYGITDEEVRDIYQKNYWDVCSCYSLPESLAIAVFDCAVNCGPGASVKCLQRALGVKDDGVVGLKTLGAVKDYSTLDADGSIGLANIIVNKTIDERDKIYGHIAEKYPDQVRFLPGWKNRLLNLRRYLGLE